MLIAISGTPGTGKTSAARILAKKIGGKLITTPYLVRKYMIKTFFDKKRKTKVIDARKLSSAAKKESKNHALTIFEGHLSHFSRADLTVILRTSPLELEKRLKRKGWSAEKVRENVEAEAVGVISSEAVAVEIDTTNKTPAQTAEAIIRAMKSPHKRKRIDWTKKYVSYLK